MTKQFCGRCRKEKPLDQFNIARGGCRQKNCQPCLDRMKELRDQKRCKHGKSACKECEIGVCEHGKLKYICKDCGGGGICEHDRHRSICKECKGSGICEHDRQRNTCRECRGGNICEHDRRRYLCKECKGSGLCEHDRQRSHCKECKGSGVCEHGKLKYICKECGGSGICEHKRRRNMCKKCKGSQICEHGRSKCSCKECGGSQICEHDKQRHLCKECGGSQICEHNRRKYICKICDPGGHLKSVVGSMTRRALHGDKKLRSLEYLCCDIDKLKSHLESQFVDGMTWDNYGEWQIDHITPIKYKKHGKTPSLDRVIKRLHYTNLQPLWAEDNLSKGNRYVG